MVVKINSVSPTPVSGRTPLLQPPSRYYNVSNDYPSEYERAIKFKRFAEADVVTPWADSLAEAYNIPVSKLDVTKGYDEWSRAVHEHLKNKLAVAGVFADKLHDLDDPRADIVYSHINRTTRNLDQPNAQESNYADTSGKATVGQKVWPLDNGYLGVAVKSDKPKGRKPKSVSVRWEVYSSHPTLDRYVNHRGQNGWITHFDADMTPGEARAWADRLPDHLSEQVHNHLDTHFGRRK